MIYIIKDSRHERKDGRPQFMHEDSVATYDMHNAKRFNNKAAAMRAAKAWIAMCDYCPESPWVTVIPLFATVIAQMDARHAAPDAKA